MYGASQVDEMFEQWKKQGMTKEQLIVKCAEAELGWPYVWGAVAAQCTPSKREYYANRSSCPAAESKLIISGCQALNGSGKSCGGCTFYPDNMRTLIDDCQGFVKQVCSRVGISFTGGGASSMWRGDNWERKGTRDTLPEQLCCIFWQNQSDPNVMNHIGFYIGGGMMIHCSGTVKKEKLSAKVTHWAIPRGLGGDTPMPTHSTIRRGSSGPDVVECQQDLIKLGYDLGSYGADGKFGAKTEAAVKSFQSTHVDPNTGNKLKVDGIVGPASWAALDAAVGPEPVQKLYTVTINHLTNDQANTLKAQYPNATVTEE